MASRDGGSLSRTFISAPQAPTRISSPPFPRIGQPPAASPASSPAGSLLGLLGWMAVNLRNLPQVLALFGLSLGCSSQMKIVALMELGRIWIFTIILATA